MPKDAPTKTELGHPPPVVYLVIGTPDAFQQAIANLGRQFFMGNSAANRLFASQAMWKARKPSYAFNPGNGSVCLEIGKLSDFGL